MIFYAKTDIGNKRKSNEDSLYVPTESCGFFALVADGMGGHNAGEVASKIVSDTVKEYFQTFQRDDITLENIIDVLSIANTNVYKDAKLNKKRKGMGSTATLAIFQKNKVLIGQVGDSRAYIMRNGVMSQITKDHSYVQMLVDSGRITQEEAWVHPQKNIITRAIGTESYVNVDVFSLDMECRDVLLLCSDGLNSCVSDDKIAEILDADIKKAAERLVDAALKAGGSDNISVVIAVRDGDCV